MKRFCAITLFAAICALVAISGCTEYFDGSGSPTPVPTSYGPVPSPLPTAMPTPTPGPAIAHSQPSNDVYVLTSPIDYKAVVNEKTYDGRQYENITLLVINDGTKPARNIKAIVTIIDEYTTNTLVYQEFSLGDFARGDWTQKALLTDVHEACNYIKLTVDVSWGEFGEYYNPKQYENTISFIQ
jgi:hypothetical protein